MAHREIRFLAVLLAAFVATGYARPPKKILNGENASILDFPYLAIMRAYNEPDRSSWTFCEGVIIDAKHIMTAAHCLFKENSADTKPPEMFDVVTGIDNRDYQWTEQSFQVLRVIPHPDYNRTGEVENDIAILKLDRSMSFNNVRQPAELPKENIGNGEKAIVAGWGYTTTDKPASLSRELQKLTVTVSNPTLCRAGDPWDLHSTEICTISQGSTCGGDSGSPLSFNGTVIGIVSTSVCKPGGAAVFTRVHSYLSWIKSIIEEWAILSIVDYF